MANTYLTRTISSEGNRKIMTFSAWIKRTGTATGTIFATGTGSERDMILFESDGKLQFSRYNNAYNYHLKTNRQLRDPNAWFHIVCVLDTTQNTASDRLKIYINGVQETSFHTSTYPSQDYQTNYNQNTFTQSVGRDTDGNQPFDGCMSHVHYVDGTAYQASTFGSVDNVTGEWQINTSPTLTMGTNGFTILKDGNTITDQSSNSNNFTLGGGTLTKTQDNPSNNFATINRLLGNDVIGSTVTFKYGNLDVNDPNGSASGINPNFISTLGMPSSGKWYAEVQPDAFSTGSGHSIGIYRTKGSTDDTGLGDLEGSNSKIRYIFADTAYYIVKYGTNNQTGLTSITAGQTVGLALDLDNGTLQYYVNGVARHNQITGVNSANDGYDYFFQSQLESSSSGRYGRFYWNFGNGAFNNTQLTGTTYQDSNGQGIFKYQPPTNFLALCTKNLNE